MNRHVRTPGSSLHGSSKATATTLCQKCLKRDIYECKGNPQERPYVSRPSRTQQLFNPKLMPKLSSDTPQPLLQKKGLADEILAKAELEGGRKRERFSEDLEHDITAKRRRSASSGSVSTISTGISRSPSPNPVRTTRASPDSRTRRVSPSPVRRRGSREESRSPQSRDSRKDFERKRRRSSVSSMQSSSSKDSRHSSQRAGSRSTRRRYERHDPSERGRRRSESRSPYRPQHGSGRLQENQENRKPNRPHDRYVAANAAPRERSLSPFSKRLALTKALNG